MTFIFPQKPSENYFWSLLFLTNLLVDLYCYQEHHTVMNYNNILVCIAGEQFSLQQVIDANMDDCPLAQEQIDMIANASIGETVSIDFGAEEITIVSK